MGISRVAAVILLGASLQVANADQRLLEQVCAMKESVARDVMTKRQNGESLSAQLKAVDLPDYPKESAESKTMVMQAYEMQRWQTDGKKRAAIDDFANRIAADCLKTGR